MQKEFISKSKQQKIQYRKDRLKDQQLKNVHIAWITFILPQDMACQN